MRLGPRNRLWTATGTRFLGHGGAITATDLHASDTVILARHPSQQAAHHLPCGRPPDSFGPPSSHRPRQRAVPRPSGRDRQQLRAFVATRSGVETMPSPAAGAQDEADITEDTAASLLADLDHGRGMWSPHTEAHGIAASVLAIHGPEHLVELRTKLLEHFGLPLMWVIMLTPCEYEHLAPEDRAMHAEMRVAWLSAYAKGSELVLQHWLWKLLRDKSHTFGALLQIFVDIPCSHRNCGSDVYNAIFTQYPLVGPSVTHKLRLIARTIQFLLTDRSTDSEADFVTWMDKVNTAHAQLQGVPPMSMSDLFALVALVGMDRSKHGRYQKAYRELIADIDAGNAVSLDKVLQIGLKHARRSSRPVTALAALRKTWEEDCSCNPRIRYTCPNCAKDSRGNTPRSTRSSSPRSPRQPRGFKSQLAQDLDAKYKEEGLCRLDPMYCIYAVALAVNDIAPEQVLIDANIKGPDKFEHDDAGRHLYEAVRQNFPEYLPSAGVDLSMSQNSED